jgi:hypothetical protein
MRLAFSALVLLFALGASTVRGAEECTFKWDIHQEHSLFIGTAKPAVASSTAGTAANVDLGALYAVKLASAEGVQYDAAPGKKMLTEGTYGGMLAFKVPKDGTYRVALDGPYWIDVVLDHQLTQSKDFGGPQNCPGGPRKLVAYELKGGATYLLQISGAPSDQAKVSVTAAAP